MKQLSADLVIVNEKPPSYNQDFQGSLEALVHGSQLRLSPDYRKRARPNFPGARRFDHSADTRATSKCGARADSRASRHARPNKSRAPSRSLNRRRTCGAPRRPRPQRRGTRGNTRMCLCRSWTWNSSTASAASIEDGREYVIVLGEGLRTPEPWVNVIANPDFGFLVSESGSSFTWSMNSHENQIDAVVQRPSRAILPEK